MSAPTIASELLDLKMLPAWLKEPGAEYSDFEGETEDRFGREGRGRGPQDRDRRPPRPNRGPRDDRRPPQGDKRGRREDRPRAGGAPAQRFAPREHVQREDSRPLPAVEVRFLPEERALANVTAQIKAGTVAYSVFALARLFLERPERYSVKLNGSAETPLFRLGESGEVAADRALLEARAFNVLRDEFYKVEVTQSEPIKGNYSNVARHRMSGTLLGPTNHHAYQPQLRSLYEQQFSRRMSFADFQKGIEIVSDLAVVEQWKEQARSVTTFTTLREDQPVTFNSAADAERHFRLTYLPTLIQSSGEMTIGGVASRALQDRGLSRVIEQAWANETRSPAKMMQELAGTLRGAGLNIFRHRRGMLFVSPIRLRVFGHERSGVSASVNGILERVAAKPGIDRKQLLEQMHPAEIAPTQPPASSEPAADGVPTTDAATPSNGAAAADEQTTRAKRALASDLRWLISEGYLIEFNDGSLDLPRAKAPSAATNGQPPAVAAVQASTPEANAPISAPPGVPPIAESTEQPAAESAPESGIV
jgi:hypothetical protein